MHKRFICLPALAFTLFASVTEAELKIGYVNVDRVLEKAPQAEKAKKDLEKEFSPRNKRIVSAQKELRDLDEKYRRDSAVMSDAERRRLEKQLLEKKRELGRSQEEFKEDFQLRRNDELSKLQREIYEAIQAFAKEEKFDLLLTHGVIYAGEAIDVTEKIQKKLR